VDLYFVFTDKASLEAETIKVLQPRNLLMSYWYHRNKGIQAAIDKIGYTPEKITLDSGAWSAHNNGKNISIIDYMKFIDENKHLITSYVALDVIGDAELTKRYYDIMLYKGYDPIPVFHAGADSSYLKYYVESIEPNTVIALGGTAAERSKERVRNWVQRVQKLYPNQKFHLLGSSSKKITDYCDLYSVDSSTWIMMAVNGFPKEIKGKTNDAKIKRATWQMTKLIKEHNQ
jgi:hypothetical protein